jgi:hypothetical protein
VHEQQPDSKQRQSGDLPDLAQDTPALDTFIPDAFILAANFPVRTGMAAGRDPCAGRQRAGSGTIFASAEVLTYGSKPLAR